jgi:dTMP kinase
MQKGMFIVLDGNDGSGKATQAALLAEYFASKGVSSEKMDFPAYERNFFGAFVGECLAGKHGDFVHMDPKIASSLYALDRLESTPQIRAALDAGKIVIADRFSSSNQIHQGGKIADTEEREAFLKWLDKMEHEVLSIPRPDAIIYLRVPVEISLVLLSEKRKAKNGGLDDGQKDTVEEDRNYLERSHETANWLASHQPNWHIVHCVREGAMRTREDIHEEVAKAVSSFL